MRRSQPWRLRTMERFTSVTSGVACSVLRTCSRCRTMNIEDMPVTRRSLEKVVAHLKERADFRFEGPLVNGPHDGIDVFPAVDDSAFDPFDAGERNGFLMWSREADGAFDEQGKLTRPLP